MCATTVVGMKSGKHFPLWREGNDTPFPLKREKYFPFIGNQRPSSRAKDWKQAGNDNSTAGGRLGKGLERALLEQRRGRRTIHAS